jgi:hypothetical protein
MRIEAETPPTNISSPQPAKRTQPHTNHGASNLTPRLRINKTNSTGYEANTSIGAIKEQGDLMILPLASGSSLTPHPKVSE